MFCIYRKQSDNNESQNGTLTTDNLRTLIIDPSVKYNVDNKRKQN